ncbi:MAG: TolC family protein [Saprospiraceae bacterium]
MKRVSALILGLLFLQNLHAQQEFSLDQAIQYALVNQNSMKQAQADVQDAEGQLLEYKASGMPTINGNVRYEYNPDIAVFILPDFIGPAVDGKLLNYNLIDEDQVPPQSNAGFPAQFGTSNNLNIGAELNALLFDGSFFVGLKAQKLYRQMVANDVNVTAQDVKLNVKKAFLAILITERNKEIMDRNITNLESTLRETKAIYENGFAEKLDVDRLQLSLNNLEIQSDKIDRLMEVSYNLLKFQMGYPIDDPISIVGDLDELLNELSADEVIGGDFSIQARPEYAKLQLAEELANLNIKRFKAGYLPSLYGFGRYAKQLQRNDLFDDTDNPWFTSSTVGVSLNVPIFDGFNKKAQIQRAKVTLEETLLQRSTFEKSVKLEVYNARATYQNAKESVESTEGSLELAQNIYETTQIKYKEGVGSSVEVSQAERELYQAQSNYTNALYELLIAKTDLDKALGKL